MLTLALLMLGGTARADTISGTIKDPSGAAVAGARIEITGGKLSTPVVLTSDESGRFVVPNLSAGLYTVRVTKAGFEDADLKVELHGTAELVMGLTLAGQQTRVTVTAGNQAYANSDPIYRQFRDIGLGETYRCENFTFSVDVGTFVLKSGTITLLDKVNNFITGVIFVGQGHFTLKPASEIDARELTRRNGGATAEEDFTTVIFRFTPREYLTFTPTLILTAEQPAEAKAAFEDWKNKLRHRHDPPEGFTQSILESETMDNVDADLTAAVDNAAHHPPFFNAYMHGAPHKDLRFFVRTRVGAVPQLDSPEEVALINCDGGGLSDGIWYSDHLASEVAAGRADSREDRRLFATKRYSIETVIAKNDHLFARATLTFEPLIPGERVLKFGLPPSLRVERVTDEKGRELHFIQEDRKQDGSFYAILDQAPEMGKEQSVSVEYAGDKVLNNAGGGSYYVGARESWYPNLNGFGEKALYDLTFKVPPRNVVISVGKLEGESTEEGFAVSHWATPIPVAVAGFNYGQYKKMDYPDDITHYNISGYYLAELPDSLHGFASSALAAMNPSRMTKYALDQARAQMQLCTFYFGKAPYDNVDITEQPNFFFGQSWPSLVYLPIVAYIDSTQRWMMFGTIDRRLNGFVREVTPHEVAHQWFGHGAGWASYHDQWLSEGFAEFAAGLFLQEAVGTKWRKDYVDFWEQQRDRILEKDNYGISPNDAGPLWLGLRLMSPRTMDAYQGVTYSKGAYVLQMLRSLMRTDQGRDNHDQAFIDMMHDFMETHRDSPASTESFKAIAEKHMTKQMDLQRNGRLDWFFAEWVYGTQVPRYQFKYDMLPGEKGAYRVRAELTQSEVDEHFAMLVPVFADFGEGPVRLGQVEMVGNSTRTIEFVFDRQPKKVELNALKDVLQR